MRADEAIELLQNSELKQVSVKDDTNAMLGFINLAILEIYKRFDLWNAEAVITQVDGTDTYTLVESDTNVTIDLSDNKFLHILSIKDANGDEYSVESKTDEFKITMPKYDQIKVHTVVPGSSMYIVYKAAPLFITADTEEIQLPYQFIEPMMLYAGYKGQASIKSGVKEENNTQYMRFEASCNRIELEGLFNQDDLQSTKFEQRGFV